MEGGSQSLEGWREGWRGVVSHWKALDRNGGGITSHWKAGRKKWRG